MMSFARGVGKARFEEMMRTATQRVFVEYVPGTRHREAARTESLKTRRAA